MHQFELRLQRVQILIKCVCCHMWLTNLLFVGGRAAVVPPSGRRSMLLVVGGLSHHRLRVERRTVAAVHLLHLAVLPLHETGREGRGSFPRFLTMVSHDLRGSVRLEVVVVV